MPNFHLASHRQHEKKGPSSGLGQLASLLRFYHPWKLLITIVMPPSSTRPLLASRSLWSPSLLRPDAARTWSLQTVRYVSRESMRNSMRRESQQAMKQGGGGVSIGEMRKESITEFYKNSGGPFFPCWFYRKPAATDPRLIGAQARSYLYRCPKSARARSRHTTFSAGRPGPPTSWPFSHLNSDRWKAGQHGHGSRSDAGRSYRRARRCTEKSCRRSRRVTNLRSSGCA